MTRNAIFLTEIKLTMTFKTGPPCII